MKKLFLILILFTLIQGNAQSFQESIKISGGIPPLKNTSGWTDAQAASMVTNLDAMTKMMSTFGAFDNFQFNNKGLDGSIYLFENWENRGEIQIESKKYVVSNINYNIKHNKILMRIEGDSTFVFDIINLDKLSINGRQFTSVYNANENDNRIYEVIYQDNNRSLLKGYFVSFIEASPNPMVNRGRNEIKQGHSYFIYENGKLKPFRMKKSNTLSLVNNDKSKELERYVKSKHLSYKKEKDMVKIFDHVSEI
jgi:hypothetical protein